MIGGPLRKFGSARTIDNFVNFGNGLTVEPVVNQVAELPVVAAPIVAPLVAITNVEGPKIETMAPTVEVVEEH
jgi:hypothetical protein